MAEGARLESVYTLIAYRGFESLPLRQYETPAEMLGFFIGITSDHDQLITLYPWFFVLANRQQVHPQIFWFTVCYTDWMYRTAHQ